MEDVHTLFVSVNSDLPDFRLFAAFLWSDNHSIDSDGDRNNPASKTWTYLYMASRELENQNFEVTRNSEHSSEYEVTSGNELIAKRVAYFLARETSGQVTFKKHVYTLTTFGKELGADFNVKAALERSDRSEWRKATESNPYPNLNTKK